MSETKLLSAAFLGLCPRCGQRTIFAQDLRSNPAKFMPQCDHCGLNYDEFNVGDGPAALLTLVMGALLIVLALSLELSMRPPFWVHIILWVPITALLTIFSLRIAKGMLLILEYRNKAGEAIKDAQEVKLKDDDDV